MSDPNLDEAVSRYEGPFLESAEMMHDRPQTFRIKNVIPPNTERDSKKKLIERPMLVLEGAKKDRFVLSKTNVRILKAVHGRFASEWIGQEIAVGVRYLKEAFGQENVPTLRIIPPDGTPLPMVVRKFYGQERPFTPEDYGRKPAPKKQAPKPQPKLAEKKDNVTLLRSALQVAGCKTEEDADLVVRWISEGAYTLQSAKATLEDAGVVHDALLQFTRGGKRLDRALPLAREWDAAGQASEAFGS